MLGPVLARLGVLIYLFVLSKYNFGAEFPVLGMVSFLVLPLINWWFFSEAVTLGRRAGTLIIAIGMLIVARS